MSQVVEREVDTCRQNTQGIARSALRATRLPLPGSRTLPASRRLAATHSRSLCAVRPGRRDGQSVNPVCAPTQTGSDRARRRAQPGCDHSGAAPAMRWRRAFATAPPANYFLAHGRAKDPGLGRQLLVTASAALCATSFSIASFSGMGVTQFSATRLDQVWRFVSAARIPKPSPLRAAVLTKLRR